MAQLKDLLITGPSRFIGKVYANEVITSINHIILQKPEDMAWGSGNEPSFQMVGANNKIFKFKFSTSGQNVDVGWDWAAGDGSGAAFRGASAGGSFIIYARNSTSVERALIGNVSGTLTWIGRTIVTGASVGSASTPVYIDSSGYPQSTTYSLNATINAGTASKLAYYSGANAISSASITSDGTNITMPSSSLITAGNGNHQGLKLGDAYITAINGSIIFQNNTAIRFGTNDWDWNCWAGLRYVHNSKTIYLGLADNVQFTANSAQSGGSLYFPGVDKVVLTKNSGGIYKYQDTATNAPFLQVNSNNLDTSILKIDGDNPTDIRDSQAYGFNLKYIGTGGGAGNTLRLYADNSAGTDVLAMEWSGDGKIGIGTTYSSSYRLYVNGDSYFNGNISVSGLINNFKLVSGGSLNADDVRTTNGFWVIPASITNAAITNHGALVSISNVGTPSQFYIPDSSHLYIYKRWYSSSAWSAWNKISAGYADTAGTFSSNATITLTGDTTGTASATKNWTITTTTNEISNQDITVQTGSTAQAHISQETFINWLITKGYIPNQKSCYRVIKCSWSYAGNDILQLTYDGKNYELQLAGCLIEFMGYVNNTYADGNNIYRLIIHTSPTNSFTVASGYIKVPTSSDWEFTCNGSGYTPTWRCISHVLDYNNGTITRFGYSTSGMTSTSWLTCWDGYNLRALNPTNNNIGALTAHRPLGFASDSQSSAGWGNQTGTGVTTWNDSSGGSIEFRKENPSSGKISIKVDGRFYGNEGNNPAMLMTNANGYWGMGGPDAQTNDWIRTTSAGIIPYQGGGAGSGHCGLGTSSWYFSYAYIDVVTANTYNITSNSKITYNASNGCVEIIS